jgi:hypothetical protein
LLPATTEIKFKLDTNKAARATIAIAASYTVGRVSTVSPLLNLKAAQQGRSVLFSDEQKLLFKGSKKGFA